MVTARSILTFVAQFVYHTFKVSQILLGLYITVALLIVTGHSSLLMTCLLILVVTTAVVYAVSLRSAPKLGLTLRAAHGITVMASVGVFMAVTKVVSMSQVLILALGACVVLISGKFVSRRTGTMLRHAYVLLLMVWVGMYANMQIDGIIAELMVQVMVEGVIAYLYLICKSTIVAIPQESAS